MAGEEPASSSDESEDDIGTARTKLEAIPDEDEVTASVVNIDNTSGIP